LAPMSDRSSAPFPVLDDDDDDSSALTLKTISALVTETSEAFHAATNRTDLLRAASRHCARLVNAETVRIWLARRGGKRLVALDFSGGDPVELWAGRGEGLAGWAMVQERTVRRAPGEE